MGLANSASETRSVHAAAARPSLLSLSLSLLKDPQQRHSALLLRTFIMLRTQRDIAGDGSCAVARACEREIALARLRCAAAAGARC